MEKLQTVYVVYFDRVDRDDHKIRIFKTKEKAIEYIKNGFGNGELIRTVFDERYSVSKVFYLDTDQFSMSNDDIGSQLDYTWFGNMEELTVE